MSGAKIFTPQLFARSDAGRERWQYKILNHLHKRAKANEVDVWPLVIFIAILGHTQASHRPQVGHCADISPTGNLVTDCVHRDGTLEKAVAVYPLSYMIEDVQRACDACKLSDADRVAAFEEFRKYIRKDHRVKPEYDVSKGS